MTSPSPSKGGDVQSKSKMHNEECFFLSLLLFPGLVHYVAYYAGEDDKQDGVRENLYRLLEPRMAFAQRGNQLRQYGQQEHHRKEHPTTPIDKRCRLARRVERVGLDQHQRRCRYESNHRKAKHSQAVLEVGIGLKTRTEVEVQLTDSKHNKQARQDNGKSSQCAAQDAARSRIAHIGGTVDTYR